MKKRANRKEIDCRSELSPNCSVKLSMFDMGLIKAAIFFFALWFATLVNMQALASNRWLWFALFLVFIIKPFWSFWIKRK